MSSRRSHAARPAAAAAVAAARTSAGGTEAHSAALGSVAFDLQVTAEFVDAVARRVLDLLDVDEYQQYQQQEQQWLTTQQAAVYLAVPVSRVYRAVSMRAGAERPIPVHKDGAHSFFLRSELDAWRRAGGAG